MLAKELHIELQNMRVTRSELDLLVRVREEGLTWHVDALHGPPLVGVDEAHVCRGKGQRSRKEHEGLHCRAERKCVWARTRRTESQAESGITSLKGQSDRGQFLYTQIMVTLPVKL